MDKKYSAELKLAKKLVKDAKNIFDNTESFEVNRKGWNDYVTTVDLQIEKKIIDNIRKTFKNDLILSEETSDIKLSDKRTWVIDPLDGTHNFLRGIPIYGLQFALIENFIPIFGVIYIHNTDETLIAVKGHGAFLNSVRVHANKNALLNSAVVTLGDFSKSKDHVMKNRIRIEVLSKIVDHLAKIKMWGAACYDFFNISTGKTDVHIMFSFKLWDVIPGYTIAKEAGCYFKQVNGDDFSFESKSIVVSSNKVVLDELLTLINS